MTQTIEEEIPKQISKRYRKRFKKFINKCFQLIFAFVIVALACLALSKLAYESLYVNILFEDVNHFEFLISFTLSSFFPISAIAYLLFQRDTQRRKLARGFWLLGINVRGDLDEDELERIETNLDQRQERHKERNLKRNINLVVDSEDTSSLDWDVEAYGEYFSMFDSRSNIALNYIAQSILTILATILGLSLFISNQGNMWGNLEIIKSTTILEAMQFGFLGAYIFSIQLVYRRYTTFDLQPMVYMNCALTMIGGIVFNFVAFEAINTLNGAQNTSGLTGGIFPILAFSLGYFPYLAIRWFDRLGYTALGVQERRANALPLGLIDGISQFHETRLRDEGIDNLQNLASAALDELLINTRFSASEVIAWVDQAILYLYLELNEIEIFRRGGIRCFTDLQDYWGPHFKAYHTVGTPTRKLIETFRHPKQPFSGLKGNDFQDFSQTLVKQVKEDYTRLKQWENSSTANGQTNGNNNLKSPIKDFVKDLEEDRKSLAIQLKTIPDYLDALYLATKSGPNVSYIKHYWDNVEDIANTTRQRRFNKGKKTDDAITVGKKRAQSGQNAAIKLGQELTSVSPLEDYNDYDNDKRLLKIYKSSLDDDTWKKEWDLEDADQAEQMYFHFGMAIEARSFNKTNLAERAYKKAIEIAPNYSEPYNALAWFYHENNKNLEQAEEMAEKAVNIASCEKEDVTILVPALDTLIAIKLSLAAEKEANSDKKNQLLDDVCELLNKMESNIESLPKEERDKEREWAKRRRSEINELRSKLENRDHNGESVINNQ